MIAPISICRGGSLVGFKQYYKRKYKYLRMKLSVTLLQKLGASGNYVYFVMWYILLRMHVCFPCVRFSFSVLSQEIGWEERL